MFPRSGPVSGRIGVPSRGGVASRLARPFPARSFAPFGARPAFAAALSAAGTPAPFVGKEIVFRSFAPLRMGSGPGRFSTEEAFEAGLQPAEQRLFRGFRIRWFFHGQRGPPQFSQPLWACRMALPTGEAPSWLGLGRAQALCTTNSPSMTGT
jgi:hypothetical protein